MPLFKLEKQSGQTTATFGGCVKCLEDDYFWSSAHNILKYGAAFYGVVVLWSQLWFLAGFVARLSTAESLFFLTGQPST